MNESPHHYLRQALLCSLIALAAYLWLRTADKNTDYALRSMPAFLQQYGIAGALVVIRDSDGELQTQCYGHASSRPDRPLDETTRFPIASLSKPLTAAAIRKLIREGQISLDSRLVEMLPDLPYYPDPQYHAITVRHLLQHTSGLDQSQGDPMFSGGKPVGCVAALSLTLKRPLQSKPGSVMRYSNAGYCLLGLVLERTTGLEYPDAVRRLLDQGTTANLTLGPPTDNVPREGQSLPDDTWRTLGAAGGWFSDGRTLTILLSKDAGDPSITTPTTAPHDDYYYGLGWRVWSQGRSKILTHFGSLPGMFATVRAHPDGGVAVAILNGRPFQDEKAFLQLQEILRSLQESPTARNRCN